MESDRSMMQAPQTDSMTPSSSPLRGQLSPLAYFADFFVYPALAIVLVAFALAFSPGRRSAVCLAFCGGVFFWTFAEYLLHRYFFHHIPGIMEKHEAHHQHQKALIGTPTWLSLCLFLALVWSPAVYMLNIADGGAFTAGMMLGYIWYVAIHYGMHHWKSKPDSLLARLKRRHALHHHYDDTGNFGVTSGLWDFVFRTNLSVQKDPKES